MPTDFSFFQTPALKTSSSAQCFRTKSCAAVQSSESLAKAEPWAVGQENFLSTFQKVSQNQNSTTRSCQTGCTAASDSETFDSAARSGETFYPVVCCEDQTPTPGLTSHCENEPAEEDVESTFPEDFLTFKKVLEKTGFPDWSKGTDFGNKNQMDGAATEKDALATLYAMGTWFEQGDFVRSGDILGELERLRLIIAKALAGNVSSPAFSDAADGLGLNQPLEPSDFDQLIKGIYVAKALAGNDSSLALSDAADGLGLNQSLEPSVFDQLIKGIYLAKAFAGNDSSLAFADPANGFDLKQMVETSDLDQLIKTFLAGEEGLKRSSGFHTGESSSAEKALAASFALIRQDSELAENVREIDLTKTSENTENLSQMQNREKHATVQLVAENHTVGAQGSDNGRKAASIDLASMNALGSEEDSDNSAEVRADHRANRGSQVPAAFEQRQRHGSESVPENLPVKESSPVSKMIEDAQTAKEKQIKMSAFTGDEFSSKLSKVDISYSDNGLLNSQSQSADKAFETAFSSKETEASQGTLRNQTLDQIVRKAVIHLRNGQHEARIDLKPDFLGHIRMRIITENNQVTVKILAEFPFVKDMIENNVHQLKADLQQQGLTVDKLEVSVSRDSNEYRPPHQKNNRLNARHGEADHNGADNPNEKKPLQARNSALLAAGAATVDYFA